MGESKFNVELCKSKGGMLFLDTKLDSMQQVPIEKFSVHSTKGNRSFREKRLLWKC